MWRSNWINSLLATNCASWQVKVSHVLKARNRILNFKVNLRFWWKIDHKYHKKYSLALFLFMTERNEKCYINNFPQFSPEYVQKTKMTCIRLKMTVLNCLGWNTNTHSYLCIFLQSIIPKSLSRYIYCWSTSNKTICIYYTRPLGWQLPTKHNTRNRFHISKWTPLLWCMHKIQ